MIVFKSWLFRGLFKYTVFEVVVNLKVTYYSCAERNLCTLTYFYHDSIVIKELFYCMGRQPGIVDIIIERA